MDITFNQYISNPMVKNSAVFTATAREAIRNSYIKKYDSIMVRERGVINYFLYEDKKNNRFYAHFKIPSEVVPKFYYDTVIEFYANETVKNTQDLFSYYIKMYSNDPSFVFTYAYVFKDAGLFVDGMDSKMSKKALHKEAKEKNPYNQVGYVKAVYFAYLYMKTKGLNNLDKFKAEAAKYSSRDLLSRITPADEKVNDRISEGEKIQKKKKVAKPKENPVSKVKSAMGMNIKPISNVSKTKSVNGIKGTKTVKTVKKK